MTSAASVLARRLAGSLAGALVLAACGLPDSPYFGHVPPVREPGHLRYCGQGEPETLDPTMAGTTVAVLLVQQLFDGLLVYDLDGKPVPGLAERWEASSDLRTFTFHLRRGARWSNGRALDAYDLGYQVLRVLHPTTASANASNLPVLRGAAAFLERRLAVLRQGAGELRAGQAVEIVATSQPGANPNLRQVTRALPLRDLGAAPEAAYAAVPPGSTVELVGRSGSNVFPAVAPARADERWAYVYWDGGGELARERYGWVRADELGPQLAAAARFTVSRLRAREQPGPSAASAASLAEDDQATRPTVEVPGAALELSPEGLGVRVVDRFTLVLETNGPAPYFAHLAVNRALRPTPIEAVSRWPRGWASPSRIVTSGPLHLKAWRPRDRVELVRAATYWNPAEVKLDALTVYSLDDATAAANLYYAGRCDAVATNQIPGSYLPALRGERRASKLPYRDYHEAPFLSSYFVLLNTRQLPSVHLRRALSLAIDRRPIPAFTHGGEHPTAQIVPGAAVATLSAEERALCGVTAETDPGRVAMIMVPGERCYLPPPGLDYDPRRAAEELALARRELGAAFPARLTYRYNEGSEVHRAIAELLQQQWQRAGISVELRAQEWGSLLADTARGEYQLARFGNAATLPDPATEYLELFACGSPFNRTGYCSAALDRRLTTIRTTADAAERDRQMRAAEEQLVSDAVIIPLYVYTQRHLRKPYVRDLGSSLVDQPPLYRAWLDPDWRRHATEGGAP